MDGIIGIHNPGDDYLVRKLFLATGMNQHRGKASAGIAIANKKGIYIHKGLGRIGEVVNGNISRTYCDLEPVAGIGNVGYTKNSIAERRNAEPIQINPKKISGLDLVLTMDGYLVRENDLKNDLEEDYRFNTVNKAEVMGALLHKYLAEKGVTFEAGKEFVDKLHGRATFAITALVHDGKEPYLITLNDDKAFEPFCFGTIDSAFIASSESCAHRRLGGHIKREYNGAEMTICSPDGVETKKLREDAMMPDIFQAIYFGSPISLFRGKEILQIRRGLGLGLVNYYKTSKGDVVIPNPDSGLGVSVGIAEGLGKVLYPALVKMPQAVRTFQEGERGIRSMEVGLKFGGIESLLRGKNIDMGDDSIVRGSVSEGGSAWVVFNCGANSLEFWVSYGPMFFPSFKEWHRGIECLHELAAQRAFAGENPYDKSLEEINNAVSVLNVTRLKKVEDREYDFEVRYNTKERIEKVTGPGSFQALDASYPIDEKFWPEWLKKEVEEFHKYRKTL